MTLDIVLVAGIVLLVAWLTAAATAVRSVSRMWLREWAQHQLAGSEPAASDVIRPRRLLIASRAGVAALVALCGALLATARPAPAWLLLVELAAVALLILLAGQLLPRAIARRWAPRLVPVLLPPLRLAAMLVNPLVRAANALTRAARPQQSIHPADSLREDVEDLLREGELEGIGEPEENRIITGVVQFGETMLREVMTPLGDVVAIDATLRPADAARAIARSGYSRVPVYRGTRRNIIGMVHALDVFKSGSDSFPPLREVTRAPGTASCSTMLFEMLGTQRHLALVLDDAGVVAGVVTLEDVLEALVGGIRNEAGEERAPAAALRRTG
jgi:putative hemolysin